MDEMRNARGWLLLVKGIRKRVQSLKEVFLTGPRRGERTGSTQSTLWPRAGRCFPYTLMTSGQLGMDGS